MNENHSYWLVIACVGGPLLLSLMLNGWVRRWALRRGFVDRPEGRKGHDAPVPLGGGPAIVAAFLLPVITILLIAFLAPDNALPAAVREHRPGLRSQAGRGIGILAGMAALCLLGWADDRRPLGPLLKFAVQLIVVAVVVVLCDLGLLTVLGPAVSIPITVLWIVLIVNAFNFLDNMDGLSAGVAVIVGTILAWAALRSGQLFVPLVSLLLVGSLLGFLTYNFWPASLFMGDAGSLPIGYLLGVLTVMTTYYHPQLGLTPAGVFVPIVVLAVPLYDVASVILGRWRAGAPVFVGDQRHFSHRLVQRGMKPRTAVLTIYLATAATGLGAIFLPTADVAGAAVIIAQTLCVVLIIALLESAPRKQ